MIDFLGYKLPDPKDKPSPCDICNILTGVGDLRKGDLGVIIRESQCYSKDELGTQEYACTDSTRVNIMLQYLNIVKDYQELQPIAKNKRTSRVLKFLKKR